MTTDRDDSIRQGFGWQTPGQFVVGLAEPPPDTRYVDTIAEAERIRQAGPKPSRYRLWEFEWEIAGVAVEVQAYAKDGWFITARLYERDGMPVIARWEAGRGRVRP
jgi:hypothetical protein